jgi:hypothetical protein
MKWGWRVTRESLITSKVGAFWGKCSGGGVQVRRIGGLFGEKGKFTPPQYANVFDFYSIMIKNIYKFALIFMI